LNALKWNNLLERIWQAGRQMLEDWNYSTLGVPLTCVIVHRARRHYSMTASQLQGHILV